ncbi:MAG: T9SS type A sorting domain-containing protein [Bacteroidota bacterium]
MFAQSGIQRVWAVDDGEKIKKTNVTHTLATSSKNKVWNGSSVSLFGGRNEVVAFQLVIQGNATGATGVNVTLDSLYKSSSPSYTIKNTGGVGDPYNYVGKRIEMFVQHYMNINVRSSSNYVWWSTARPLPNSDFMGLIPEQLVPFEAPSGSKSNGQGGAPFSVTASQNQAIWVDVYIPKSAQPGNYVGTMKVTENSILRYSIPVNLQVYNLELSDTTHLYNMFHIGYPGITARHGVSKGSSQYLSLMKKYYAMGHRHRADFTDGRQTLSSFTTTLAPFYTGSYYSSVNNYEGPGVGVGNRTYSIGTYDQPNKTGKPDYGEISGFTYSADTNVFKSRWQTASNQWVTWFETNAPQTRIHKYMADEPGLYDTSVFYDIRRKARWLKTNPGSGSRLKTLCTTNIRPDLRGSIDFWMHVGQSGYINGGVNPYPGGYMIDSANAARARGERVGIYNGTIPAYGTNVIDAPATNMRATTWISWKHKIDLYYLWYVNHWGDESGTPIDPWAADKRTSNWGDGSFVYAGQNQGSTSGNDRGLSGPISGIRMKNWRRGAQDYEYLYLAQQMGINVTTLVDSIVPKAFDQTDQTAKAPWKERGYDFETVRRQLAELIANASSPLPSGSFIVQPPSLLGGPGNVTFTWTSVNAQSASIDQGVGPVPLGGSLVVFVDTSKTFTLTLTNALGSRQYSVEVTVLTLPSGTLSAIPDTLLAGGGTTTISWTSSNSLSAEISPVIGIVPSSGSQALPLTETTMFTLLLSNNDGTRSYTKTVYVRGNPVGSFFADADSVPVGGGDITFFWTSTNATSARIDHGIGNVELNDSITVRVNSTSTFALTLTNPFGSTTYVVNIYKSTGLLSNMFVTIPPESLVAKDLLTGRIRKPERRGRGLYPNWINLLSEVVIQGGFQPTATESDVAGGMRIGVATMELVGEDKWKPHRDSAATRGWARLTKWNFRRNTGSGYTSILGTLEGREGKHSGDPRGLDSTGTPGESRRKLLTKQQTKLNPKKHNNKLFAELVALKFNIASSQLGKTPYGFGELVYNVDGHPCDGLSIVEIAARADSAIAYWRGRPSLEFTNLHNAIHAINRAFVGGLDTAYFEAGGQLQVNGVAHLSTVPFLSTGTSAPLVLYRTTTLTSVPEDQAEEELFDSEVNPVAAKLFQNYPNPFNPSTVISVGILDPSLVTIKVYNILGQLVSTVLNDDELTEGVHTFDFVPNGMASGVYFYRMSSVSLETGEKGIAVTRKMLFMK